MSLRTDRRRLLLADETLHASTEALPSASEPLPAVPRGRYASAAERDNQPRMIDFVPLHPWSISLTIGLGGAIIALLLLAHVWLETLGAYLPAASLAPFDLTTERSLATWFASLLLLANMQLALVLYALRKHRVDDYHGRYRIWLWIASASLVASVEMATGISGVLKAALGPVARYCGLAEPIALPVVLGLLVCYLAIRALMETRRSPATLLVLGVSGCLLLASLSTDYGLVSTRVPETVVVVVCGTHLAGCLLLLVAAMLYSRHVMQDVEGKLPAPKPRQPKPAKEKNPRARKVKSDLESAAAAPTATKRRVDPPQKPKPQLGSRTTDLQPTPKQAPTASRHLERARPAQEADEADEADATSDASDLRSLSRTERKRLKREAKRGSRPESATP